MNNYRPISLLCILSKVLERIVYNQVVDRIHSLFTIHQFGFLAGRSAVQKLLAYIHSLLDAKQHNTMMDVVYMDFKKAFDSVPHNQLLIKLRSIGIHGSLLSWFQYYLTSWRQCVRVGDSHSQFCDVISGVPQGSILGPLLFVIYVNDLPSFLHYFIPYMFADDTKCVITIDHSLGTTPLQSDLVNVSTWSSTWRLLFNESKFVHMRFWQKSIDCACIYHINGKDINQKTQHKDLGIILTNDLNWSPYYISITSQSYKILGLLCRTFTLSTCMSRKKLYILLVRSQLLYCSQVWKPYLIKDIITLERVQRRATKFILNDYYMDYKNRLLNLHVLPLMYIYEFQDIMFLLDVTRSPPLILISEISLLFPPDPPDQLFSG